MWETRDKGSKTHLQPAADILDPYQACNLSFLIFFNTIYSLLSCESGLGGPLKGSCQPGFAPYNLSFKNKHQVHIAYFLYLQVQKNAYVYLDFEFLAASTHSQICVLASTKKWLCVLAPASTHSFFLSDKFSRQIRQLIFFIFFEKK